ncbi:hypothetical protein WCWAEYFT_CDS0295 [Vibrio phage VB_VaC_TDDLMA]
MKIYKVPVFTEVDDISPILDFVIIAAQDKDDLSRTCFYELSTIKEEVQRLFKVKCRKWDDDYNFKISFERSSETGQNVSIRCLFEGQFQIVVLKDLKKSRPELFI